MVTNLKSYTLKDIRDTLISTTWRLLESSSSPDIANNWTKDVDGDNDDSGGCCAFESELPLFSEDDKSFLLFAPIVFVFLGRALLLELG